MALGYIVQCAAADGAARTFLGRGGQLRDAQERYGEVRLPIGPAVGQALLDHIYADGPPSGSAKQRNEDPAR